MFDTDAPEMLGLVSLFPYHLFPIFNCRLPIQELPDLIGNRQLAFAIPYTASP
jgi:hypothetical protein